MGKRKRILVIGLIVVIALSSFAVVYYRYRSSQIDTSWAENVNQMVKKATPYPNGYFDPALLLSYCRVYLIENGTSELIQYDATSNQTLSAYLTNLLIKANLQLQPSGSISSDFLGRILASDNVVAINYRLSTLQFGGQQRFSEGYFVLGDNLNEGLSGKIITVEVGKQGYSLWAISK
jgi:hypothetical protein